MNCFGFTLLHSVIGSKFSRHFFNQLQVKPKPIVRARAWTFSRSLCRLRVITSSFDWFTGLSSSFLIGQSNYFGFGLTKLDWNSLYFIWIQFLLCCVAGLWEWVWSTFFTFSFLLFPPRNLARPRGSRTVTTCLKLVTCKVLKIHKAIW